MEQLPPALHLGVGGTYPNGRIVHELEAFQYEYTAAGVRYAAPAGMHDDCVCALALAVRLYCQPVRRAVWPSTLQPAAMPTFRRRGLAA
jgi:hypothetical protein